MSHRLALLQLNNKIKIIFVQLGFSSKSWNSQQKFSGSLSVEQADKKSSSSLNEVDTF
jgi:hypothetical protein